MLKSQQMKRGTAKERFIAKKLRKREALRVKLKQGHHYLPTF
jgi:hypothetical protein